MKEILERIVPLDPARVAFYQKKIDQLTKPLGSLGRLEEVASRFAAIRHPSLETDPKALFTFAADHGVSSQGVSPYPAEVTAQMVANFLSGGAAINVLCRHYSIRNIVVDMGVNCEFTPHPMLVRRSLGKGTRCFLDEPAMDRSQAESSLQIGAELALEFASQGYRLLGTGEMGIGNTTASSAVLAALTALPAQELTGSGAGLKPDRIEHKIQVVRRALSRRRPDPLDPVDVLSKVGGFEIGAIAGLCLGGAACGVPVVIDGFISTAGALLAMKLRPAVADYLFFSHCSHELGHRRVLDFLGVRPLLNLDLRLGEGTGAALAIDLISASMKLATQMATFEEAGVSRKDESALPQREGPAKPSPAG